MLATMDIGSLRQNEKPHLDDTPKPAHEGLNFRVMISDHDDEQWDPRGDLRISRSTDNGESWSVVSLLTKGEFWHQAPANVWHANGGVYLVMKRRRERPSRGLRSERIGAYSDASSDHPTTSGDHEARSPHDTNIITFHRVSNFRSLICARRC